MPVRRVYVIYIREEVNDMCYPMLLAGLAVAAGGAQYIVTGDEHLLKLGEYVGIRVLTPAAFVALKEAGQV